MYVNVQVANGLHEELDMYRGERGEWSAYFVIIYRNYFICKLQELLVDGFLMFSEPRLL